MNIESNISIVDDSHRLSFLFCTVYILALGLRHLYLLPKDNFPGIPRIPELFFHANINNSWFNKCCK